jgi:hypothetical protein
MQLSYHLRIYLQNVPTYIYYLFSSCCIYLFTVVVTEVVTFESEACELDC